MAKMKTSTISILVMAAVVLASVGYLFGSIVNVVATGPQPLTTQQKGHASVFSPPMAVPNFTLTDQKGQPFSFSSTKGKAVLMAFLYTHCNDVCPFSAVKMRETLAQMGTLASKVELVVVDTDPARDTVPLLAGYSKDLGLYDTWHILTGPVDKMQSIYKTLKITVIKADEADVEATTKNASDLGISLPKKDVDAGPTAGLTPQEVADAGNIVKKYSGCYEIAHDAPFWIIDPQGFAHSSMDVSSSPTDLALALKQYLQKS